MASRRKGRRHITATELAALGRCERQAMYKHHGHVEHTAPEVEAARRRGEAVHEQRHKQLTRPALAPASDRRCFIATSVYGPDAWQTDALRHWRDQTLLPTRTGTALVRLYYRLSPALVTLMHHCPWLAPVIRRPLDAWADQLKQLKQPKHQK